MHRLYDSFPKIHNGRATHFRILRPGEIIQMGDMVCTELNIPNGANLCMELWKVKNWIAQGQFLSDLVYYFVKTPRIGEVVKLSAEIFVREEPYGTIYNSFTTNYLGDICTFRVLRDDEEIDKDDLHTLISPDQGKLDQDRRLRAIKHIVSVSPDEQLRGYHHPFYQVKDHTGLAGEHKGRLFIRLLAKQFFHVCDVETTF